MQGPRGTGQPQSRMRLPSYLVADYDRSIHDVWKSDTAKIKTCYDQWKIPVAPVAVETFPPLGRCGSSFARGSTLGRAVATSVNDFRGEGGGRANIIWQAKDRLLTRRTQQ